MADHLFEHKNRRLRATQAWLRKRGSYSKDLRFAERVNPRFLRVGNLRGAILILKTHMSRTHLGIAYVVYGMITIAVLTFLFTPNNLPWWRVIGTLLFQYSLKRV